jgi:hypothetical protein
MYRTDKIRVFFCNLLKFRGSALRTIKLLTEIRENVGRYSPKLVSERREEEVEMCSG